MAAYTATNLNATTPARQSLSSTLKSIIAVTAATATLTSGAMNEFTFGCDQTPADNAMLWDVSRCTTAGTGTSATAAPVDPAKRASGMVVVINCTANPTTTANSSQFSMALNQRASFRWVAVPGSELIIPATNTTGLTIQASSGSYTGLVNAACGWTE